MSEGLSVFAYGTLLVPEIALAVVGRLPVSCRAELHGFARYLVKHEVYPGVIPEPGAVVAGMLYSDVRQRELALLDEYEGPTYERREVEVRLVPADVRVRAQCYVVREALSDVLSAEPWDLDHFVQHHCAEFRVAWH